MRLAAVKPTHDLLLQLVGLGRVFRFDHSPGQLPQFFRAEPTIISCLSGKFDHLGSFFRRQPFDFFDHFNARHVAKLSVLVLLRKLAVRRRRRVDRFDGHWVN